MMRAEQPGISARFQLAAMGAILIACAVFGPTLHRALGGMGLYGLIGFWAVIAFAATRVARHSDEGAAFAIIALVAVAIRMPLLFEPPYLSSDMYRYVWDGRVQGAGINPYAYIPAAPELAHLRDEAIYPHINRADYAPTIYPPVAQFFFWMVTRVSETLMAMKLAFVALEAVTVAALVGMLRILELPRVLVVAYAWHPLPVWEIAGNAHIDAAMLTLTVLSLWLFLSQRERLAGVFAALAVFVKPTALLLMPVYWRPWDWRLPLILVATGLAVYAPFLGVGTKVFGFLSAYIVEEELSSGSGFRYLYLLQSFTGPLPGSATIYLLMAGSVLAWLALRIGFRKDRSPQATIAAYSLLLTAFLILLTPHFPWYYLALAPMLVLTRQITPWVLVTGSFLIYDVIDGDTLPILAVRDGILHTAALFTFIYDVWSARSPPSILPLGDIRP